MYQLHKLHLPSDPDMRTTLHRLYALRPPWPWLTRSAVVACLSLALILTACHSSSPRQEQDALAVQPLELWYTEPAADWLGALPVGNGRLGAMVHGGVEREVLQLNEDTVWAGGPQNNVDPSLKPYLEQITELVFANRHEEAQAFANESTDEHTSELQSRCTI